MRDAVNHFGMNGGAPDEPAEGDTIAAIATAAGEAGIAIIRVSGPASLRIADAILEVRGAHPSARPGGTFVHGFVKNPSAAQDRADETICLIFRAPHSYTGEDVVELQCHGGRFAAERVLKAALSAGARVASPGEFTRRAFLNGRIDLLQAEAVLDLIRARSDSAVTMALRQLDGVLTSCITDLYANLISTLAELEADLDFSEDEVPELDLDGACGRLGTIEDSIRGLLATSGSGRLMREGALLVIAGQPNAGKSTLMNRLLNHERSIVSETPGTTRDVVEDTVFVAGVAVRVADTAGLRDTSCSIEQEGIRRARKAMDAADIILYVVDGSVPASDADFVAITEAGIERTVLVRNKSDLGIGYQPNWLGGIRSVDISAKTGAGEDALMNMLCSKLRLHNDGAHPVMIAERHNEVLRDVLGHVSKARGMLDGGTGERLVLAASELHSAADSLGTMTGKNYNEDLLDSIFGRFCIGK